MGEPDTSVPKTSSDSFQSQSRPIGITVLVILEILSSILILALIYVYATNLAGNILLVVSSIVAIAITLFIAYGYLKGAYWSWVAGLISAVIGIISSIMPFDVFGLVINGVIVFYLLSPNAKKWFGSGSATERSKGLVFGVAIAVVIAINAFLPITPLSASTSTARLSCSPCFTYFSMAIENNTKNMITLHNGPSTIDVTSVTQGTFVLSAPTRLFPGDVFAIGGVKPGSLFINYTVVDTGIPKTDNAVIN